jgi:hypothetical protein
MNRLGLVIAIGILLLTNASAIPAIAAQQHSEQTAFRPPAVPLVTSNPYLSIWSMADRLTDNETRHWTRREHPLTSLIRIDGKAYRLMGSRAEELPPLAQVGLRVLPTRTIYDFEGDHVRVTLTFMTAALPDDLDVLARPLTYLTWDVRSTDDKEHSVSLFAGASSRIAADPPGQTVAWKRETIDPLVSLHVGTVSQRVLQRAGDFTSIDWGYLYVAAPAAGCSQAVGTRTALETRFARDGVVGFDDAQLNLESGTASDAEFLLAFGFDEFRAGKTPVSRHILIAYDELYAIKFLGRKLLPYWRRNGAEPADLLRAAERDYESLTRRCAKFDEELMADLTRAGGERYAQMAALAYRQALAGCGLAADAKNQALLFPKENSSNGCVATVDVIYPAAPLFLLMGPTYARALVAPALIYSTSPQWKFPFAPHDVGVYPQANGQVYGGGESSTNEADMMPVEESANLILLCAAIARLEGNADFAGLWWPQLSRWEAYLERYGRDPENQLCTDDFMGHLAHNANLSIKAILAIAAYGELCSMRGDPATGLKYHQIAQNYARNWMAVAADSDHFRIAFDKPATWSQKYNLIWDKVLGLGVFPADVARKEVAYYKKMIQRYGVPLDSRTRLTKADWCFWSATLADDRRDFEAIISPIFDYLNETTARLPFVDSYVTDNPRSDGMRARPVIGGVFIKLLEEATTWKKWSSRDHAVPGRFAPAPLPPRITEVVATSQRHPATWRFTLEQPPAGWQEPDYDDGSWKQGPGGFGTKGTPGAVIGTNWNSRDIWLRRKITIPEGIEQSRLQLLVYHDEDAEIFLDGVLAASESGYVTAYQPVELPAIAQAKLKPGATVVVAVHCHQTGGGQGIDVGLIDVIERDR